MKIPKTLNIGCWKVKVKQYKRNSNIDMYGSWDKEGKIIMVSKSGTRTPSGEKYREREWSFLHECTHAILEVMGKDDLSEDEGFVDALSAHILQVFKQIK